MENYTYYTADNDDTNEEEFPEPVPQELPEDEDDGEDEDDEEDEDLEEKDSPELPSDDE